MNEFPLVYRLQVPIFGRGFIAGVEVRGHALLVHEDDGTWWVSGVQPGGLADTGDTPASAYAAFRNGLVMVLIDSQAQTDSYAAFSADVHRLLNQVSDADRVRWTEARDRLRAGAAVTEPFLANLPRAAGEIACGGKVVRLNDAPGRLTASATVSDQVLQAA